MTIYKIDAHHKVEVEGTEKGTFIATFYEKVSGKWTKLGKENWHNLEDLKWEYGIE